MKFMAGFGLLILLFIAFTYKNLEDFPWFILFVSLFVTVGQPVQLYFTAKRNYNSNWRISETIVYEFDNESIQLTGESFNSKLSWNKIFKVTENNDWILIWQNRQVANVVPKRDFKNEDLRIFKDIVNAQAGLINKLKKQ
jgi:hypothetical protein